MTTIKKNSQSLNLYSALFLFSSMLMFLIVLADTLVWSKVDLLSAYLLIVLFGIATWASRTSIPGEEVLSDFRKDRGLAVAFLGLTVAAFFLRFTDIAEIPIWADEDFHNGRLLRNPNTLQMATWLQQPPLYYYCSVAGRLLFGDTFFAVRFFTALLGSLSVPLFFSLLLKTCRSKPIAFAGALLFLGQPWLIAYAKEGKPYSHAIFFCLLFFHSYYEFTRRPLETATILPLSFSTTLFFLSIGMQPPIVILSCAIAIFFYLLVTQQKQAAIRAALALGLSALIYLPFQWNIIRENSAVIKPLSASFFLKTYLATWTTVQRTLTEILEELGPIYPSLLIALLIQFILLKRRPIQAPFQQKLIFTAILYPFLFTAAFGLLVNWNLNARYLLLYVPIYILSITYAADIFHQWATEHFRKGEKILALILICIAAITLFIQKPSRKPIELKWNALYRYLESQPINNAVAFTFTLNQKSRFTYRGFITLNYYYTNEMAKKIKAISQWDALEQGKSQSLLILEELDANTNPSEILLFSTHAESDALLTKYTYSRETSLEFVPFYESIPSWNATLVRLKNTHGFAGTLERFLSAIDRQEPREEIKVAVIELLAGIHIHQQNCPMANKYMSRLERANALLQAENFFYLQSKMRLYCSLKEK